MPSELICREECSRAGTSERSCGRIEWIDVLRGISIISVMLGHCGIEAIRPYVFVFHLPVFFLASGFFWRGHKNIGISGFTVGRLKNLILPYYVACIPLLICYPLLQFSRGGGGYREPC